MGWDTGLGREGEGGKEGGREAGKQAQPALVVPCQGHSELQHCNTTRESFSTATPPDMPPPALLPPTFMSTVRAPPTPRSSAVTGTPARLLPMTMRPSRSRMSAREVVTARMAITSAGWGRC